jgi:hypothetical protein
MDVQLQQLVNLSECPICLDILDDPWMCADGFCYCRECIGRWIADDDTWRSPRTNVVYLRAGGLLARDVQRNDLATELRGQRVRDYVDASLPHDFEETLRYVSRQQSRGVLVLRSTTARDLIVLVVQSSAALEVAPQPPLSWDTPLNALEVAAHCGSIPELCSSPSLVEALLALDSSRRGSFVAFSALLTLLLEGGSRLQLGLRRKLWRHCHIRAHQRDGVYLRPDVLARRGVSLSFQGIYIRHQEKPEEVIVYRNGVTGALLQCPQHSPACPSIDSRATLEHAAEREVLTSRYYLDEDSGEYWRARRRGRPPPFPDAGSDEEPDLPGHYIPAEDERLLVVETRVRHLPRHFEYWHRLTDDDLVRRLAAAHDGVLQLGRRKRMRQ